MTDAQDTIKSISPTKTKKCYTIEGKTLTFKLNSVVQRLKIRLKRQYLATDLVYERGGGRQGGCPGWYVYVGSPAVDQYGPIPKEYLIGLCRHFNAFNAWQRKYDMQVVDSNNRTYPDMVLPAHLRVPSLTKKEADMQRALGIANPAPIACATQLHGTAHVTAPVTAPETPGSGKDAPNSEVAHTSVHVTVSAPPAAPAADAGNPDVPMVRRIGVPDAPMTEKELWELKVADLEMDWLLEPEEVEGSYYTDPATGRRVYWDYSDDPRLTEAEKAEMDNVA